MKKNYISPAIETLEVNTAFAICDNSPEPVGGDNAQGSSGNSFGGGNNAPRRRPF